MNIGIGGKDYFRVSEVESWGANLIGPLRASFLDKVATIVCFEFEGVRYCKDKQLDKAFRGSAFAEGVFTILADANIPSVTFRVRC